jgi:hypothetical protein
MRQSSSLVGIFAAALPQAHWSSSTQKSRWSRWLYLETSAFFDHTVSGCSSREAVATYGRIKWREHIDGGAEMIPLETAAQAAGRDRRAGTCHPHRLDAPQ